MTSKSPLRVAFRAAASPSVGGGHVVRCVSLAEALAAAGASCTFFVGAETLASVPLLARSGHQLVAVPSDNAAAISVARQQGPFDWLVVDDYSLTATDETPWRSSATKIAVLDDLANRPHDCDLLVDSAPARKMEDYIKLVPKGATLLMGPAYAPLRAEFGRQRPAALAKRESTVKPQRLLVSFGLSDPGGITGEAVEAIGQAFPDLAIDVVAGPAVPKHAGRRQNIIWHTDPPSMSSLMIEADIALGAAGSTAWERACLGLPSLAVILADNQQALAEGLKARGALYAFQKGDWPGLISALGTLLGLDDAWRRMSRSAALLCDGLGANRLILELEPPLSRRGLPVRLRPACRQDSAQILAWQTAPGARAFSSNPEPPSPAGHEAWMAQKLGDPGCIFNIIEENDIPTGVLRLDQRKDQSLMVSILIADAGRNQGIGLAALQAAAALAPGRPLYAKIDDRNLPSLRLFGRAGFIRREPNLHCRPADP